MDLSVDELMTETATALQGVKASASRMAMSCGCGCIDFSGVFFLWDCFFVDTV